MALQIIGSGFGRTGTRSLKDALEHLGFDPCHHMYEVMANPPQVAFWKERAAGGTPDWTKAFEGYAAQVDWPGAHVWADLLDTFPQAKVLHSHRDPDVWWASFSKTIGKLMNVHGDMPLPPHVEEMLTACEAMIMMETFGTMTPDAGTAKAAYMRRLEQVRAAVPENRLLVYDVAQGWGPLCAFLGVPVPEAPFPHRNRSEDFWESLGGEPA